MGRVCTVCAHRRRRAIDTALLDGESYRSLAKRFRLSPAALLRHRAHVREVMVKAHDVKVLATADNLLSELQTLHARAIGIMERCEEASKAEPVTDARLASYRERTALHAMREARGCLQVLIELAAELREQERQRREQEEAERARRAQERKDADQATDWDPAGRPDDELRRVAAGQ